MAPGITSPIRAGRSWCPCPSPSSEEQQLPQVPVDFLRHFTAHPWARAHPTLRKGWNRENLDGSQQWEVPREEVGLTTGV